MLALLSLAVVFLAVVSGSEHCPLECRCSREPVPTAVCDTGGLQEPAFLHLLAILPHDLHILRVRAPDHNHNNFSVTMDLLRLESLRELHLVNCGLTSLGQRVFSTLRHLRRLNVAGNRITFIGPETFQGTGQLEHLNLARNRLDKGLLPTGAFAYLSKLQSLDLSANNLQRLPGNLLLGLDSLLELNLAGNAFRAADLQSLLSDTPQLRHLKLRGAPLQNLDPLAFQPVPLLQSLSLSDAGLTDIPTQHIQPLKELTSLDLSDNKIANLFPYALVDMSKSITSLNLSGNLLGNSQQDFAGPRINRLEDYGIHRLALANSSLVELDLSRNGYAYFSAAVLSPVAHSLKILHLSGNRLGGIEADQVAGLRHLRDLHLASISMPRLPQWLPYEFQGLRLLNISGNPIEFVPAGFAAALIPSLRELDISDCLFAKLGPHGQALALSGKLTSLRLAGNPWLCDCSLQPLLDFLRLPEVQKRAGALRLEGVRCAKPEEVEGQRLDEVPEPAGCTLVFSPASGLTQQSELGVLIGIILAVLALLAIAGLIGCYARLCGGGCRGRSYRTREGSKGHLSPSSSEPSETNSLHPHIAPTERLF